MVEQVGIWYLSRSAQHNLFLAVGFLIYQIVLVGIVINIILSSKMLSSFDFRKAAVIGHDVSIAMWVFYRG